MYSSRSTYIHALFSQFFHQSVAVCGHGSWENSAPAHVHSLSEETAHHAAVSSGKCSLQIVIEKVSFQNQIMSYEASQIKPINAGMGSCPEDKGAPSVLRRVLTTLL